MATWIVDDQVTENFHVKAEYLYGQFKDATYDLSAGCAATYVVDMDINDLHTVRLGASYNFNLGGGTFRMSENTAVFNQAKSWLDNLGTAAGQYDLTFYQSGTSQDLVTGELNPVPLPAGMVLLVSAFGLMATRRRKG